MIGLTHCPHLPDLLSDRQERDFNSSEKGGDFEVSDPQCCIQKLITNLEKSCIQKLINNIGDKREQGQNTSVSVYNILSLLFVVVVVVFCVF